VKTYGFENVHTWGQVHPDQYIVTVTEDGETRLTTIRVSDPCEVRDIVNLLNAAPEVLRSRVRQMTYAQTFGREVDVA
jgi:hypothetical protein